MPSRTYTNTLREEHAAQTRAKILEATMALLAEAGDSDVAIPDVASRAGVSLRTVYRNFSSRDVLLDAVAGWITEQVAQRTGPFPANRAGFAVIAGEFVHVVFELERLYRALFATAEGRAAHRRSNTERSALIQEALATELHGASTAQRRRFAAVIHLIASSNGVLFLHDYADLSPDDIVRATKWATNVLADAVSDPDRRKEL